MPGILIDKVKLWKPFIAPSLKTLLEENKANGRRFGVVKPDPGNLKFFIEKEADTNTDDRAINQAAFQQVSLFEAPLAKLPSMEDSFGYRFTSDGHPHRHYIHDWEAQAAYLAYRRRYGDNALEMLQQDYGQNIPARNPHLIMGTMKAHP